jgi:hypothetical protein
VVGDEEQARRCQAKLQNLTFTDQALLSHGNRLLVIFSKKGYKKRRALSVCLSVGLYLPFCLSISLSPSLSHAHTPSLLEPPCCRFIRNKGAATDVQQRCKGAATAFLVQARLRCSTFAHAHQVLQTGSSSWRPLRRVVDEALQQAPWCRLISVAAPSDW